MRVMTETMTAIFSGPFDKRVGDLESGEVRQFDRKKIQIDLEFPIS